MDNDCVNACGDTQCVGNAGETCNNCMSDCATMNPVCGNGHCDPGEDSTNCQTDCGPGPWPAAWDQNGMDLVTMISSTRTAGYTCPGGSMVTAGPIAQGPDPTEGARHLAWEIAHQMNYTGLSECNGITYIADINAAGYTSFATTQGASTPAFALSSLLSTSSSCMQVMAGGHTTASAAMAVDGVNDAWLVFFK